MGTFYGSRVCLLGLEVVMVALGLISSLVTATVALFYVRFCAA